MHAIYGLIFRALLALAPQSFRARYGAAMREDFRTDLERSANGIAAFRYASHVYADLVRAAIDERTANVRRDIVYALRSVRKTPGFAIIVVGTLALAIGANTAVFSVLRGVVLSPLPYDDVDRLVVLHGLRDGQPFGFSLPDFADLHAGSKTLATAALAVQYSESHVYEATGEPHAVALATITPQYFDVFGVKPIVGRFFRDDDVRSNASNALVVSERFWRTQLAADPRVVGRIVRFEDTAYRVIGIAPARISPPGDAVASSDSDAWRAISERRATKQYNRDSHYFDGIARLRPAATLEGTRAELGTIFAGLRVRYPQSDKRYGVGVNGILDELLGDIRPTLFAIFAAVAAVLAIASANVANLLLGRASARERELVVRLALGASRRRVIAQLMTETFGFVLAGGALGLGIAYALVAAFVAARPTFVPRIDDIRIDAATLAYTLGVVVVVTIAAGLAPAFALSRRDLATALHSAGRSGDASRGARGRAALVVFEIACTLALVVVAGLTLRSYAALTNRPLGFDPSGLRIVGDVQTSGKRFDSDGRRAEFFASTLARVRAIPGVANAAWSFGGPFLGTQWNQGFRIVGTPATPTGGLSARNNIVDSSYFAVYGEPLRRGRIFTAADRAGARDVVVVNEAFAHKFFGSATPLGKQLDFGSIDDRKTMTAPPTIVGVVADARNSYTSDVPPTIFRPIAQAPPYIAYLAVKTNANIALDAKLADAIVATDPHLVRPVVTSLEALMIQSAARTRLTMQCLLALALIAFALALTGIFAVVSYGVSQRTHEFGIRLALGARPIAIRRAVVARAMRVAFVGIAIGVVFAALATRAFAVTLYDVAPLDPLTFATVIALILFAALGAALVPAWRATRVDPVIALRAD